MTKKPRKFAEAVEHFDRLPDCALIDSQTLQTLTGKHRNTINNWTKRGVLPAPVELNGTSRKAWRVGDVRRALGMSI